MSIKEAIKRFLWRLNGSNRVLGELKLIEKEISQVMKENCICDGSLRKVGNKRFSERLNRIENRIGETNFLWGDSYWFSGPSLWEPTVMIALKDLCKPGSIVFDVGGNMGGITSAMSRLVGPAGKVCTFEASPRIVGILQGNVVSQGHNNVTIYNRAVYSKSNEIITIYEGDHLNDSIYADQSPTKIGHSIKTLALDDFCDFAKFSSVDLIKMDIEGAEYEALLGSVRLIDRDYPHLILEQSSSDMRCFNFLKDRGYIIIDLASYNQILSSSDFPSDPNSGLRNVLCLHHSRISQTIYKLPFEKTNICMLYPSDFSRNHLSGLTSKKFELEAGRYLLEVDFTANGTDNNMMCGIRSGGIDIFRYHGYSKLISGSYRDWVICLPQKMIVYIYFDFHDGTSDQTFELRGIKIKKLQGLSSPLWSSLVTD